MNAIGTIQLPLEADKEQIRIFVDCIFRYADPGTLVPVRSLPHDTNDRKSYHVRWPIIQGDLNNVVAIACEAATLTANDGQRLVFAPPLVTVNKAPPGEKQRAATESLANGLAITAELDSGAILEKRRTLESLLGPATIIIASGGEWIDPTTGEVHAKIHMHWRLSEPTRTPDEHQALRQARNLVALLVGADRSAIPLVHPLRWPGSWHTKVRPVLARIISCHEDAEVHLTEVVEKLEEAVEAAGIDLVNKSPGPHTPGMPQADIARIEAAIPFIPNPDLSWKEWNELGATIYNATKGSSEGLDLWIEWSQKSAKYVAGECQSRWEHFHAHPFTKLGAGSLFWRAKAHGWAEGQTTTKAESDGPYFTGKVGDQPNDADDIGKQSSSQDKASSDNATPVDDNLAIAAVVERFNKSYCVVNEGGKALVFQRGEDLVLKRRIFHRMQTRDLNVLYMNEQVQIGVDAKGFPVMKPVAPLWLHHPARSQFIHGITFDPTEQTQKGVLNLWQGFNAKPAAGDWSLLKAHIKNVVCSGNEEHFKYLMGWMARLVQFPAEQGEVAVVMRGEEGCGKGTVAQAIKDMIGHHALRISNPKHLIGNFNAHLRDVVFLFADEAFFAGDKQHVGVLKSLITENSITIEGKGVNAIEAPNYLHLMMASNESWVVPAAIRARRFFVLDVPDTRIDDHDYFKAIRKQLAAGGHEAMLHELLNLDISSFEVRKVPQTKGLERQRQLSLPTTGAWWLDCLARGYVFRSKLGLEEEFGTWHTYVSTELLFISYSEFAKTKGERHPDTREELGRFFTKLEATASRKRNGIVGEHLAEEKDMHGHTARKAKAIKHPGQPPGYNFGELDSARKAFEKLTRISVGWDNNAVEDLDGAQGAGTNNFESDEIF